MDKFIHSHIFWSRIFSIRVIFNLKERKHIGRCRLNLDRRYKSHRSAHQSWLWYESKLPHHNHSDGRNSRIFGEKRKTWKRSGKRIKRWIESNELQLRKIDRFATILEYFPSYTRIRTNQKVIVRRPHELDSERWIILSLFDNMAYSSYFILLIN